MRELAKANVLMGLESTTARMNSMARAALRGEKVRTEEEIIAAWPKDNQNPALEHFLTDLRDCPDLAQLSQR